MTTPYVEFAERSAEAAGAVVAALDADQQARATFAFDDEGERTSWAYFPRNHPGLPLHAMDLAQQKSVHRLLTAALSLPAYAKVCAIMSLESVLNEIEQRIGDRVRDPGRYFISIFGAPGEARWGWRFEGHHVALNFTFEHGELFAATPLFLGANPAAVRHGDVAVIRPCGEEEDAARALMEMLDTDQRRAAIICDVAPPDFVLMNLPLVPPRAEPGEAGALPLIQDRFMALAGDHRAALAIERDAPRGIPSSALRADQRRALEQLIEVYVHRLPEALHTTERARIGDDVWFAWAGAPTRREGHYYRLQSPSFLVEYDNTQDDANHVHAVWRDPTRDFGIDALRRHVASGH